MNINQRIVYTGDDGLTKIIVPGHDIDENILFAKLSDAEKSTADVVDVKTIPTDRTFRDAWKTKKGASVLPVVLADAVNDIKLKMGSEPRIDAAKDLTELKAIKETIENE
jgi:hypothetical protein